jgi:hypothetical protein
VFDLRNLSPFSRLRPGGKSTWVGQTVAPAVATSAPRVETPQQAAARRAERAAEFDRFVKAMTDGSAQARWGHLDPARQPVVATPPKRASNGIRSTGRPYLVEPRQPQSEMQQRSYAELRSRDAGDPVSAEESASAAQLILRANRKRLGTETDAAGDGDPDHAQDEGRLDEGRCKQQRKAVDNEHDKRDDDTGDYDGGDTKEERAARARERSRCHDITNSRAGLALPVAAAHLAFESTMPRGEAISLLETMLGAMNARAAPQARRTDALRERMAVEPNPNIGLGVDSDGPSNVAEFIVAADRKRRGQNPQDGR